MGLRRLAIGNPSATTDTIIFTSDNQYLVSLIATNKSSSTPATIRIWVEPSGSTVASQYAYIIYDVPIDASNSYETFRFAINQNDVVKIYSTTANVSFQIYGLVQFDVNLGVGISSYSATPPISPVDGLIWVDSSSSIVGSTSKKTYVYSSASSTWIPMSAAQYVPYSSSAPTSPNQGDLWVDSTAPTAPVLKTYNGSAWISLGSSVNDKDLIISQRMFT